MGSARLSARERATPGAVRVTVGHWLADADLWIRCAAMQHQLGWRLDTDVEHLFTYALRLAGEKNVFIRMIACR